MNTFVILFLDLLFTITVYSLPLWIYRLLKGKELSKKSAKKFSIIYAIIAYFIMGIFYICIDVDAVPNIGPVLLWGYINYRVLIKPAKKVYDSCQNQTTLQNFDSNGTCYIITKLKIYNVQADAYREITQKINTEKFPKSKYSDGEYYYALEKKTPDDTKIHICKPEVWNQKIKSLKNPTNNETVTVKVFNCEQLKVYELKNYTLDLSSYPPYFYADNNGYFYAIEKNTNDKKMHICNPYEWTKFVKLLIDELSNLSYPDFLKAVLERLPEEEK